MKLVTVVILSTLLVGLVLLGSQDKGVSVADTSIPDVDATSPSGTTIITTAMTGAPDE